MKLWSCFVLSSLMAQSAFAWGERGHHIIAHEAARHIKYSLSKKDLKLGLGTFFNDRAITMGHLSNLPDTSWKDYNEKKINDSNYSTHFIDPEVILGVPTEKTEQTFLKELKALPNDYKKLIEKYGKTKNKLPKKAGKEIDIYKEVGVAPWHTQYLYSLMVDALKCGNSKKASKKKVFPSEVKLPFLNSKTPKYPTYKCNKKKKREEDFYAASVLAGLLSHFVGDLAQPYHNSANYDGWYSGLGGTHVFMESLVLQEVGEDLNSSVARLVKDKSFTDELRSILKPLNGKNGVAATLLNLSANSYGYIKKVDELDKKFAIKKMGTKLEWGDNKKNHPKGKVKAAERKPPTTPEVVKAFRPLIVERLAVGAFILQEIWKQAWVDAGKPDLSAFNAVSFPYPHDSPYIWPEYAK